MYVRTANTADKVSPMSLLSIGKYGYGNGNGNGGIL